MKRIVLYSALAVAGLGYCIWSYLNHSHGEQHVTYTPAKMECGSGKSGAWKYCVHSAQQGTNGGVAYLLHGRNLDEHTWNDDTFYTSLIQARWEENHQKPPVIVTISFGPVWLLAPKNSAANSGLLEVFAKEVIPEIEAKIGSPSYRALFGESMGGLNSLIAGLATNGLFQKVAALCPAVYTDSPFSPLTDLKKSMERTGAEPLTILGILSIAKSYASNDEEWAQMDPLRLVDRDDTARTTEFYVSAPLYDKYGNFAGAEALAKKMQSKGLKAKWHPLYGGHCAVDVVSLADFLL